MKFDSKAMQDKIITAAVPSMKQILMQRAKKTIAYIQSQFSAFVNQQLINKANGQKYDTTQIEVTAKQLLFISQTIGSNGLPAISININYDIFDRLDLNQRQAILSSIDRGKIRGLNYAL